MRARLLALCVVFLAAALGAAGCSSSSGSGSASAAKPKETPTGTVTVSTDGKVVCVIKLAANGTGTCKVTAGSPGKAVYTGVYDGAPGFGSARASTTVTVKPAATQGP